jgi:hypothetical protein
MESVANINKTLAPNPFDKDYGFKPGNTGM